MKLVRNDKYIDIINMLHNCWDILFVLLSSISMDDNIFFVNEEFENYIGGNLKINS